ncbi:hypothetical protein ACWF94_05470 [Streptomyces sp. NPDC055078]
MLRTRPALLPSLAAALALLVLGTAESAVARGTDAEGPAAVRGTDTLRAAAGSAAVGAVPERLGGGGIASRRDAEDVSAYWTPARMAGARPADNHTPAPLPRAVTAGLRQPDTEGAPGATPPAQPRPGPRRGLPAAPHETAVVGKVFFTRPSDGRDYVCSASALNSPSKQLVVTAGHCVNEGGRNGTPGAWMRNWTYVPRYREGVRPFGTFVAKEFRSFSGWINHSDLRGDVAMVTTWPLGGHRLVDVTGGHGLSWNHARDEAVTVWGYPGNRGEGRAQWWCHGGTRRVGGADGRTEIRCAFGGGSSGGPWLRDYRGSTGLGNVTGVMSTSAGGGWNRSPYFDDSVKRMFDEQGGRT